MTGKVKMIQTAQMARPALEKRKNSRSAQSTLEYAIFATVVVAALSGMSVYVRRSIQANLKMIETQLNATTSDGGSESAP